MKLRYFAWVRERIGIDSEEVNPPPEVTTVAALIDWLRARGPNYAEALRQGQVVRAAVNHDFARPETPVAADDEIALFPPVTGG